MNRIEHVRQSPVPMLCSLIDRLAEPCPEGAPFFIEVRNAVQAAAAGGRTVEVRAEERGDQVEVRIEDDGPGLAPDHPGEIRPFYTTRPGGLGLGLPLARKIVLLHGGTLGLENRLPAGASAVITLPVSGPAA